MYSRGVKLPRRSGQMISCIRDISAFLFSFCRGVCVCLPKRDPVTEKCVTNKKEWKLCLGSLQLCVGVQGSECASVWGFTCRQHRDHLHKPKTNSSITSTDEFKEKAALV